jgi:hypothetical protein
MSSITQQAGLKCTRTDRCSNSPFSPWIGNSEKEKCCPSPTRIKGLIYDLSGIPRASGPPLIPINRPLSIEERQTAT